MTYIEKLQTLKDKSLNIFKSNIPNIVNKELFGDNYKYVAIAIVIIVYYLYVFLFFTYIIK